MDRLEKLGLALFIYATVALAINSICNAFTGTHYGTDANLLLIGLLFYVAGRRNLK